ncbi:MAG: 7-cyano-7-deazaguanine synthase [Methanomicrobiaceae archaeon]|nr:7-cyano-7-deazaguanine synthase [Methanomicrobiaceae archaeon]
MNRTDCLADVLTENAPLVVALSGGTDSMVLLAAAGDVGVRVAAVAVDTGMNPAGELARARALAMRIGVPFAMLHVDMLDFEEVRTNGPLRCYICKRTMMEAILRWAEEHGYRAVADGTNADDDPSSRPGMRALGELGVLSPFARCRMGKGGISRLASDLGIEAIPSSSCMATRVVEHTPLTPDRIERVRKAEALLREDVAGRLRVRDVDGHAVIEAEPSGHPAIRRKMEEIEALGFASVRLADAGGER